MQLTKSNLRLYAARYYDNPFCLSEAEFNLDLYKSRTVKKMLTKYLQDQTINIRSLINVVISFYNVFEHKAATNILEQGMSCDQIPLANSVLLFLSMPLIGDEIYHEEFLETIREKCS